MSEQLNIKRDFRRSKRTAQNAERQGSSAENGSAGGNPAAQTVNGSPQSAGSAGGSTAQPASGGNNAKNGRRRRGKSDPNTSSPGSAHGELAQAKGAESRAESPGTKAASDGTANTGGSKGRSTRNSGKQSNARGRKTAEKPIAPAPKELKQGTLRLIPLGGLHEIGKNITALEYGDNILIIDCGMSFPEDEMFGIDVVIPDFTYLEKNSHKLKGLILTHGHEDHIGAIPFLLKRLNIPIYGTGLTLGLVQSKLDEHGLRGNLKTISAGQTLKIGPFEIEAIRVTHSIADALCFAIHTPVGCIFHTGDFKIDYTPVDGDPMNFQKLAEIGSKGVLLMLSDSTNAVREGFTRSERELESVMEGIFRDAESRIIIATFASNVHRIQTIINTAVKHKRKVTLSGRSMLKVMDLAIELGYVQIPKNVLVDIEDIKSIPDKKLVIITTGSQGEPMSALVRMANNDHRAVAVRKGDKIILSSTPIPGNENAVSGIVDKLLEIGAEVIYSDIADIHVSGHACREELKLMLALMRPQYFMPVHGEFRHLYQHMQLALELGMPRDHIMLAQNGSVIEIAKNNVRLLPERLTLEPVFVDGLGVGDIGAIVLHDRKLLSESGLIIVSAAVDSATGRVLSGPEIFTRGFVYVRENEGLIEELRLTAARTLYELEKTSKFDKNAMKNNVRDDLRTYIYQKTKRNPVIVTVFAEA